ncbi:WXG100 family type VII secretion target [Nocardia sp. NBC_01009]|nr:type VII secretion protein EsxR [Nocardia sp. NBC_01009]
MEYSKAKMVTLFHDLQGFRQALIDRSQDMNDAGNNLRKAWQDNAALVEFEKTYKGWTDEHEHMLQVLNKIAAAVESALHRALGTDGKIGDGFAGL